MTLLLLFVLILLTYTILVKPSLVVILALLTGQIGLVFIMIIVRLFDIPNCKFNPLRSQYLRAKWFTVNTE